MFKLIPYLKDFKKECFLGPLFKLLEAILELIVPLVMAKIIDIGVKSYDTSYIIKMGILIIILGIIGLGSALVCQYFAAKASQGFGTKLRNELFHHINSLSHSEIDNIGTPSLITRIINDVNQLQVAVAMAIRLGVRAPFIILGSAIMAMFINLKLSLIFFLSIPLIVLTLYLVMGKAVPLYRVIQKKLDKISLITRENLDGVRVVRAFSKQEVEKNRFNIAALDHSNTAIKVGKLSALLNPFPVHPGNSGVSLPLPLPALLHLSHPGLLLPEYNLNFLPCIVSLLHSGLLPLLTPLPDRKSVV
mgnify:CR=1 FL=1